MQGRHAMNVESNNRDESSDKKCHLKIFQHGSLGEVCIRAVYAFTTVIELFLLTRKEYTFYFKI